MSSLLGLLGLGERAGSLIVGVDGVRTGLQRGRCKLVVVARDASSRARDKVIGLARARQVPVLRGPEAEAMGRQLGRPPVMVVGVLDPALARGLTGAAGNDVMEE